MHAMLDDGIDADIDGMDVVLNQAKMLYEQYCIAERMWM